jgi:hypothetical protein
VSVWIQFRIFAGLMGNLTHDSSFFSVCPSECSNTFIHVNHKTAPFQTLSYLSFMNILFLPTPYVNNAIEKFLLKILINLFQQGASREIAVKRLVHVLDTGKIIDLSPP